MIPQSAGADLNAAQIIRASVVANEADWKAAPEYSFLEVDRTLTGGSKTFDVEMIDGSPYQVLVAINGDKLSGAAATREQNKLRAAIDARRAETSSDRQQRVQKYQAERKRDQTLMQQLTEAFNFELTGEAKLDGFETYVLKATPRPGYRPPNMESQVLTGMEGQLWIDKETMQWVKVEAEVTRPVSIAGLLARVDPGTSFELEKAPVGDGVWLPTHFAMKSDAKIFHLFSRKSQEDETYSGYHKGR